MKILKSIASDILMIVSIPFFLLYICLSSVMTLLISGLKALKVLLIFLIMGIVFSMYGYGDISRIVAYIQQVGIVYFLFSSIFLFVIMSILYFLLSLPLKLLNKLIVQSNLNITLPNIAAKSFAWFFNKAKKYSEGSADNIFCKILTFPYMLIKGMYFSIAYVFKKSIFLYLGVIIVILGYIHNAYKIFADWPLVYFFKMVTDCSTPETTEYAIVFWITILIIGIVTYSFVPMYKMIGNNIHKILTIGDEEMFFNKKKSNNKVEYIPNNNIIFPETSEWMDNISVAQRITDIYYSDDEEYLFIIRKYGNKYDQLFKKGYEDYQNIRKDINWLFEQITKGEFVNKNMLKNLEQMEKVLPYIKEQAKINAKRIMNGEFEQPNNNTTLGKFFYIKNCKTLEELDKQYKQLCHIYHPDVASGDEETMKQINKEYAEWKKQLA